MTLKRKASLLFMISVLLYVVLSMFVPADSGTGKMLWFNALLVSIPAFLIPSIVFRRVNKFPLFRAPKLSHILIALGLGIGCILLNIAMGQLNSAITYGMEINSTALDVQESVAGTDFISLLMTIAIIPAISEEFFMRGALLEAWRRTSPVGAMLLTSLIFGLLHASPSNLLIYFAMGMLFAIVYNITRNVWLSVIIHFINNLLSVLAAMTLLSADPETAAAAAEATEEMTRGGYIADFFSFLALALAVIIPLVLLLRNSCRKNGIGLYAGAAADNMPSAPVDGEEVLPETAIDSAFADASFSAVDPSFPAEDASFPAAEPAALEEPRGGGSLLAEPMLWIGLAVLLLLNLAAAAIEFGWIEV